MARAGLKRDRSAGSKRRKELDPHERALGLRGYERQTEKGNEWYGLRCQVWDQSFLINQQDGTEG